MNEIPIPDSFYSSLESKEKILNNVKDIIKSKILKEVDKNTFLRLCINTSLL
jgi:hypothetical protein